MLSHAVKKLLDSATNLDFSPVLMVGERLPIASYNISNSTIDTVSEAVIEVRVASESYDELEIIKEKLKAVQTPTKKSNKTILNYSLRFKLSSETVLLINSGEAFELTQFYILNYYKKGEK